MQAPESRVAIIVGIWVVVGVGCSNGRGSETSTDATEDAAPGDALDSTSRDGEAEGDGGGASDGFGADGVADGSPDDTELDGSDGTNGNDTTSGPTPSWAKLIGTGGADLVTAVALVTAILGVALGALGYLERGAGEAPESG